MPTVRRCCIVGCLSNSRQNLQLQFFQFPKVENPFHRLWKQACHASLSRILPFKKPVICALHFHPTCVGGRRLTASAVPSLRLEVPSNLKAVEQQAMIEEIERSRKCAYINAVVYEWLVRANLNPQLRGSITHGMIKEKADTAKQLIGSTSFVADNRWLNRFRETHLTGFAQKLATNLLKPLGPSLWIPDIVADLQHLFPPTSADRVVKLENIPEQYVDYMQQYGEYEEDDDTDTSSSYHEQSSYQDQKPPFQDQQQSYQEHQQQSQFQQQQQQQQQIVANHSGGIYDPYAQTPNYNYDDFYYERQNQQNAYASPQQHQQQQHQRPQSRSPPQQQQSTPQSESQFLPSMNPLKRQRLSADDSTTQNGVNGNSNGNGNGADTENSNGAKSEHIEDLTDGPDEPEVNHNNNTNGTDSKPSPINGSGTPIRSFAVPSPKPAAASNNGAVDTNGHTSPVNNTAVAAPSVASKDLDTYAQAMEYLKPLEDFALFKENFRAIGLISQLEVILRKGDRATGGQKFSV